MALGKSVLLSEFFAESAASEPARAPAADAYWAPFLQQACARQAEAPISRWPAYWQCAMKLQAAAAMSTWAAVALDGGSSDADELCRQVADARDQLATQVDGALESDFVAEVDQLHERAAACLACAVAGSATSAEPAVTVALNPGAHARRLYLSSPQPAVGGDQIYVCGRTKDGCQLAVDVPGCGFAVLQSAQDRPPATEQPPLVVEDERGFVLRNEFLAARIDPATGALAAVYDFVARGNRCSQRLVSVQPHGESLRMVADQISLQQSGTVAGSVATAGSLLDPQGAPLARFQQTYRVRRGDRVLEIELQLSQLRPITGPPWQDYLAIRSAWPHDFTTVSRYVNELRSTTEASRFESPLLVEFGDVERRTALLTGGLPYHRKSGDCGLDTLLCVAGEAVRHFRYGLGVDLPQPLLTAQAWLLPDTQVACQRAAATTAGWFFHVDARHVVLQDWQPIYDSAQTRPVGVRLVLAELAGRHGPVRLSAFRSIRTAHQVDIDHNRITDCKVADGVIQLALGAYEWTAVELRW